MKKKVLRVMLMVAITLLLFIGITYIFQLIRMRNILAKNSEESSRHVEELSDQAMSKQITERLYSQAFGCAFTANNQLKGFANTISLIADSATDIYNHPDKYGRATVIIPDPSMIGEKTGMFLYAEDVDPNASETLDELSLIGNLQGNLMSMYSAYPELAADYIGTESGIMLLAGEVLEDRWDEDGNYVYLDPRKRPWYTGAIETKGVYFTGVQLDYDTGEPAIMCGAPIYKDEKIVAVAGAGIYLDGMQSFMMNARLGNEGTSCIIDKEGTIIFSSRENGELKGQESINDDRNNEELVSLIKKGLAGESGVETASIDNENCYIAYAPIETVGWVLVSIVPESIVVEPTKDLLSALQNSHKAEISQLNEAVKDSALLFIVVIILSGLLTLLASNKLSGNIVRPIRLLNKKVRNLKGDRLDFSWDINTGDEVQTLADSFSSMTERMKQYIVDIQTVTAEKERIGAELNVAAKIQADMLPRIFPPYPDREEFDLYATMTPAKEVGGDFYDFFLIDNDHIALVMADVSGKGVPAALFMVIAKTLIKNRAQITKNYSPAKILSSVNNQLCEGNEAELFVTVWLAIVQISTGKGIAANAGHEHPALRRADGSYELVHYRHSPAVATMEDIRFSEHEFEMHPGDSLFVYTDGVTEATDSSNELFGEERLVEALNKDPFAGPTELLPNVKSSIDDFVAGAPQFDDITMLALRYNGKFGLQDEHDRSKI